MNLSPTETAARFGVSIMVKDAFADPTTAQQMPYTKEDLIFLGQIFGKLTEMGARSASPGRR